MRWWSWILLFGPVVAAGPEAVLVGIALVGFILLGLWVVEIVSKKTSTTVRNRVSGAHGAEGN